MFQWQMRTRPKSRLRLLILALGVGAIVLLPSLISLFHLFKGNANRSGKNQP
jgi:hypothetical protein